MSVATRQFIGDFEHTIDSVNRLVIPAKWRTGKSEEFILLKRDEGSLAVFTQAELETIMQNIDSNTGLSNREKRDRKQIFSSARQVTCDKQGRITMDAELLRKIGIKNTVVFVGSVKRFEIWNPKTWKERKTELDNKTIQMLDELGI